MAVSCLGKGDTVVALVLHGYEGLKWNSREFATVDGVRIGSKESDVRGVFEHPTAINRREVDPLEPTRFWYDQQGIFFDLLDREVYAVAVYRPLLCGEGHE